jgi:hypothetical protein
MTPKWKLVSVHLEMVVVSVQDWCMVYAKCITGSEIGLDALDGLGDVGHVECCSVHLEVVLLLTQDRCTVCAKRTRGLEIILDAPNGTPR